MSDVKMEGSALIQELDWKPHRAGFIAQGSYENGYGVSVLPEEDGCTYEVAILQNGKICYPYTALLSGLIGFTIKTKSPKEEIKTAKKNQK